MVMPGIGAGRNNFVDLVQDFVAEGDIGPREQIIQVLHRPWAEDRRRHTRVRHNEGHRHVGQ